MLLSSRGQMFERAGIGQKNDGILGVQIRTASVAKWLRQWIVIPPFAGSIPVVRPFSNPLQPLHDTSLLQE